MISIMDLKGLNQAEKYNKLRESYPEFIYQEYKVKKHTDSIDVVYHFSIPGLAEFYPSWHFPAAAYQEEKEEALQKLLFSLGMVELISYWKTVCSPKVKISCGYLSKEQELWWKKFTL